MVGSLLMVRTSSLSSLGLRRRRRPVDTLEVTSPVSLYCLKMLFTVLSSTSRLSEISLEDFPLLCWLTIRLRISMLMVMAL